MPATRLLVSALMSVVLSPALARAAPGEAAPANEEASVDTNKARGSHFLVEGSAGFGVADGGGVTLGGLLGAGGRVPGTALRLYLALELARTTSERAPLTEGTTELVEAETTDASLGLRGYVPVYGRLRFFGDVLFGRTLTEAEDSELGRSGTWSDLLALATGLQLRVVDGLSCGVRGRLAFAENGAGFGSLATDRRPSVAATLTAHF